MPIKEEPVRIEFQYEQEDAMTSDGVFNVEYYSETIDGKEKKYVRVTPHGQTESSEFELDFLVEVVDFLRKKGVVDGDAPEEVIPEGPIPRSGLQLPSIQVAGSTAEGSPVGVPGHVPEGTIGNTNNGIPISTFITNGDSSEILAPPVVKTAEGQGPTVVAAPTVISGEEAAMPIINRPVVRTRVGEKEDPLKALEDSRRQRGQTKSNFKRKEEADEVQD